MAATPERRRSPDGRRSFVGSAHKRRSSITRAIDGDSNERAALREWGAREAERCDGGDPDLELCELPEVLESGAPVDRTTVEEAVSRGRWLVGLLVLQSSSSFILDSYQELIKQHLVVTLFLQVTIRAGGTCC